MAKSLDSIIAQLNGMTEPEKTAGVKTPAETKSTKVASAEAALLVTLKNVEAATSAQKTASADASPAGELAKMAAEVAAADQQALVKEAHIYGTAVADGFMSRLKQYESAAMTLPAGEKTAGIDDGAIEKIAEAAVQGYIDEQARMEKVAQESYETGFRDTAAHIEKVASECLEQGRRDTVQILQAVR